MHAMVRRFVDARADLDTTDANDRTLVINAVMHNDMKALQYPMPPCCPCCT